jgi:lambda repressor-like predicted transcriptional regulator
MGSAARNHQLEAAMLAAGVGADDVARELGVDARTVRHWLAGRTPYPRLRGQVARLLGADPHTLWPRSGERGNAADELVGLYAHRADSPADLWRSLLDSAASQIDLLGYAILFLFEMNAGLVAALIRKGEEGCAVRIAVVDPTSPQAAERDAEEQLAEGLVARVRTSLRYLSPLLGCTGVEVRQHRTPMYNSVFRFDGEMLVTPHLFGTPGYTAPLMHLRRHRPDGPFDAFAGHFERVWLSANALEPN